MNVKELMSAKPQCCTPENSIQDAAQMMADCDCGAIPVVEKNESQRPVGIITDRDIALRAAAQGKDPRSTKVRECMSSPLAILRLDKSVEECCEHMETSKVRRMLVVDNEGRLAGIVSQSDIALRTPAKQTAEVVREISQPTEEPSLVC